MYFFAGSMVIGGSLDQLLGPPAGAEVEADAESEAEAEAVSEVEAPGESEVAAETGAEAVLPGDVENPEPAAEPTVPLEAQPASSNPPAAAIAPTPILIP